MAYKLRAKQLTFDSGDFTITGSLDVSGSTTLAGPTTLRGSLLIDPIDSTIALVVSGATEIIEGYIQTASLRIGTLGTFGNPSAESEIDLGGLF